MRDRAGLSAVESLPQSSVAEFRTAAWPLLRENFAGMVTMRLYLTWAAASASVCLLAFGLAGLVITSESWWLVAAGLVATGLVARRIRRQFSRAAAARRDIDSLSRQIDARAARGEIAVAPEGWTLAMPPAPHERTTSWV